MHLFENKKAVKQLQSTDRKKCQQCFQSFEAFTVFCIGKIILCLENSLCFGSNCLYQMVFKTIKEKSSCVPLWPTVRQNKNSIFVLACIYIAYIYWFNSWGSSFFPLAPNSGCVLYMCLKYQIWTIGACYVIHVVRTVWGNHITLFQPTFCTFTSPSLWSRLCGSTVWEGWKCRHHEGHDLMQNLI